MQPQQEKTINPCMPPPPGTRLDRQTLHTHTAWGINSSTLHPTFHTAMIHRACISLPPAAPLAVHLPDSSPLCCRNCNPLYTCTESTDGSLLPHTGCTGLLSNTQPNTAWHAQPSRADNLHIERCWKHTLLGSNTCSQSRCSTAPQHRHAAVPTSLSQAPYHAQPTRMATGCPP
jgi:hypothetical protein